MADFEDGKVLTIFASTTLLMFPRANVSVFTLLVALSIMSCGQTVVHTLEDIESYAEMSPDSALKSLSAIDSSDVRKGRARAMHTYVRSLARYKAYIDEYDDTDISDAAEYFHGHNDKAREMRSLYFKGYTLSNAGKLNQAIIAFTDSEKIAEELGDYFYAGLCCREMSDIFSKTYSPDDNLAYAIKARDYFNKGGYPLHEINVQCQIGQAYMQKGDNEVAFGFFSNIADQARTIGDTLLLKNALVPMAELLTLSNKNQEAIQTFLYVRDSLNYSFGCFALACMARAYAQSGDYISSINYFNTALELAASPKERYDVDYQGYFIFKTLGNNDLALKYLERVFKFATANNEYTQSRNTALYTQRDYFIEKQRVEQTSKELTQQRLYTTISVSALLILIAVMVLAELYKRVKRNKLEKELLVNRINNLSNEHSDNMKISQRYGMEFFNDLAQLYWQNQPDKVLPELKNTISRLGKDAETLSRMIATVNQTHNDILVRLSEQVPTLNAKEIKLFCFLVCQISHNAICLITDKTPAALNSNIYRLRSKIDASEAPDKPEFLGSIS